MRRRDFIAGLGSAAAWPALARAQSGQRRIGVFVVGAPPPARDLEIVQELARLGYVEGRNVTYLLRGGAGESSGHEAAVRELIVPKPEVIVGPGSPFAYTLAATTHDIPIVLTATADPVATGLTKSMSRPSQNVTGFTISSASIVSKRLELIRELLPQARGVGRIATPLSLAAPQLDELARRAAGALGLDLMVLPLTSGADIATAFATIDREHLAAIITDPDPLTVQFGATIADECLVRDLPLIESWPSRLQNGALAAYGPASVENIKGAAVYVDRILKGSKVADLPFEEPTQLKLAINLRTARSIGVNVPPTLLARADEVIE
jgi:putative ABC transport system substrate-binding protein